MTGPGGGRLPHRSLLFLAGATTSATQAVRRQQIGDRDNLEHECRQQQRMESDQRATSGAIVAHIAGFRRRTSAERTEHELHDVDGDRDGVGEPHALPGQEGG